ncbi:MAG: response regulator [Pseudomonadales bacterium]
MDATVAGMQPLNAPEPEPTILILDDDAAHAASVRDLLAVRGHRAEICTDPGTGLERLARGDVQVLLLDINMPGITGLDVLGYLRDHDLDVKTIVVSGESALDNLTPILRLGAYDFLSKPYDPQQLLLSVGNAMDRCRLEAANRAISARADAEHALHEFLVDASQDLIYMLDEQGRFRFANNRLRELFAADPAEVAGRPWPEVLGSELAAQLRHHFDERRTGERATRDLEIEFEPEPGSSLTLACSARGLYENRQHGSTGRFIGTYGVLRDVTEARRAERDRLTLQNQLQQASKMEAIGQLAGGIAHDFNNILASIIGYAELIQSSRHRFSEDKIDSYLGEVVAAGHRARDLISQMLTFTRANRGAPRAVDIVEAINDVSRMLHAAIPGNIRVDTEFADDLVQVRADPVQLQQIIINLLVNARDAIDGDGRISVRVTRDVQEAPCAACGKRLDGKHVVMAVADTGHGIPEPVRGRIFEMYFTTREPGKGTGIGLWLINNLIHEYDGHITVESAEEAGTTFRVHLPLAADDDEAAASPPAEDVAARGTIVVVDDEISVGNYVGEVLRDAGYDVIVFNESPSALRYVERERANVGLLITDQTMPLMSGTDLADRVRQLRADLPIALITAYAGGSDLEQLRGFGIDALLTKPFRIDQLLGMVTGLLVREAPVSPQ